MALRDTKVDVISNKNTVYVYLGNTILILTVLQSNVSGLLGWLTSLFRLLLWVTCIYVLHIWTVIFPIEYTFITSP